MTFFCGHNHCIQANLQTTRIRLPPAAHAKGAGIVYWAFLAVCKLSNKDIGLSDVAPDCLV